MDEIKRVAIVGFGSLGAMYAGCFGRAMGAGGVFVVADAARTATYRAEPTVFNDELIAASGFYAELHASQFAACNDRFEE